MKLEYELVTIDVDKLAKSQIKEIALPLSHLFNWECYDNNKKIIPIKNLFNLLQAEDIPKAKELNKAYMTSIWNLLDEDIKATMNFEEFVD